MDGRRDAGQVAVRGIAETTVPGAQPRPARLIVMGRQGAGKGTQCVRLAARLGLVHVSTGDLFREAVKAGSELGLRVKAIIDAGELVPDTVVIEVVAERLSRPDAAERGFVLDGFPRTVAQAELLEKILAPDQIDVVVDIDVPTVEVLGRLLARRVCASCAAVASVPGDGPASCGCGGELVRRADDNEVSIRRRLEIYDTEAAPLLAFYKDRDLLTQVDGTGDPDDVHRRLVETVLDRLPADWEALLTQ